MTDSSYKRPAVLSTAEQIGMACEVEKRRAWLSLHTRYRDLAWVSPRALRATRATRVCWKWSRCCWQEPAAQVSARCSDERRAQ